VAPSPQNSAKTGKTRQISAELRKYLFVGSPDTYQLPADALSLCVLKRKETFISALQALTMREVAKSAKITVRHLQSLIAKGEGPTVTELGRRRVVLEPDHNSWLRSRRRVPHKAKRGRPAKIAQDRGAVPAE
jgi:hypothetical protein